MTAGASVKEASVGRKRSVLVADCLLFVSGRLSMQQAMLKGSSHGSGGAAGPELRHKACAARMARSSALVTGAFAQPLIGESGSGACAAAPTLPAGSGEQPRRQGGLSDSAFSLLMSRGIY